ncbi:MAG: FliI/YscN family ATPase [Candidatus Dadabacteria bacterium]|nr:MAG: FliI/YscN family ATPase [Candidatus Dadabacteria bacterium]
MATLKKLRLNINSLPLFVSEGWVKAVTSNSVTAYLPEAAIGNLCYIKRVDHKEIPAQVIGFEDKLVKLAPFDTVDGIAPEAVVRNTGRAPSVSFSSKIIGGVYDPLLNPLFAEDSNNEESNSSWQISLTSSSPSPIKRRRITKQLVTGIRVIDLFCPIGYGQRLGLFAGPGVGKSTLLGSIARNANVDVVVVALIGERGREVREFLEDSLGDEGRKKSVVVVSTSDETPIRRKLALLTATSVAEQFREQGKDVLLLADSLTRAARAIREVGLAVGEMPVRQGYPPSVYTELPSLLERAGTSESQGSITAIYTVLTNDSELEPDPLAEEVKSILDGHITLSKEFASRGLYPAVDPRLSISRLKSALQTNEEIQLSQQVLRFYHLLLEEKELAQISGSSSSSLKAIESLEEEFWSWHCQDPKECSDNGVLEAFELVKAWKNYKRSLEAE